jgi:hypothetical protein
MAKSDVKPPKGPLPGPSIKPADNLDLVVKVKEVTTANLGVKADLVAKVVKEMPVAKTVSTQK